ncbi:hypothetical protein GmHk_13G038052 [Glycine max]|nr:hypothetical protein GmHk_13G038052 [Glycine max]
MAAATGSTDPLIELTTVSSLPTKLNSDNHHIQHTQILKPRTFLGTFYPKPMTSATSAAAWDRLKKHYASRSHNRIMSLKESLASITKDTLSVTERLLSIFPLADELSLIGRLVDDLDLLIIGLKGLGPAFQEFSASIRECDSPLLFAELFNKLVDRDFSPA